jgi:uncharacterized hydrophobic protein (TIGR00271 family)
VQNEDLNKESSFFASIKSRLILHQVLEQARAGALFTFDFLLLVLTASILAGLGLATNNAVVIVAAMLVSPLMGPVLATCFAAIVSDAKLLKESLKVEVGAIGICIVVGMVIGFCFTGNYDTFGWPTSEMKSRGEFLGLLIGTFVALASGVGVALSVLGNNTNSLVGVAISASLLPPAVNCGMLLAFSINTTQGNSSELLRLGLISLLLTILNIVCIFITAVAVFKIKEVAPIPNKTDFWKYAIPEARVLNQQHIEMEEEKEMAEFQLNDRQREILEQLKTMSAAQHHTIADYLSVQAVETINSPDKKLGTGGTMPALGKRRYSLERRPMNDIFVVSSQS